MLCTGRFQDVLYLLLQGRKVISSNLPNDLYVHIKVGMNDPVSQADDLPPGHFWVSLAKPIG